MPRRERHYRVVLDAQAPGDLAARCSATWRDLLDVAERLRPHGQFPNSDGNREPPGAPDTAGIEAQQRRPGRPPHGSARTMKRSRPSAGR